MKIKFKKLHPDVKTPVFSSAGAACFDLHAHSVNGYRETSSPIYDGNPVICWTGLSFEVPPGHVMLIFSRSGHGFTSDIRLANCVGVIDSDYRGELKVKLTCDDRREDVPCQVIKPGQRIAQALIVPIPQIELVESDELSETERGTGGLGSTGA